MEWKRPEINALQRWDVNSGVRMKPNTMAEIANALKEQGKSPDEIA